ncbi:MAG: shikimate kinase [Cyanobacteria bacterium SIG30]|nr:shikimate kinase [Cyanobacteria bacterium SIG30]
MKDNIVLIGLMGAGKTTIGRYLANLWAMNFVDFDEDIEKNENMKINEIFAKYGEKHFRELEKKAIQKHMGCENFIIATGGGIVKDVENIDNLKKIGKVIYLKASPLILFERIKDSETRPLIRCSDAYREFEKIFEQRREKYELADIIINTENKTLEEIVRNINEKLNS